MKINGNEIRPGNVIQHKGALWVAVKTQAVKPGKGPAYAQVELKNAIDGTKLNERFRSSETVERVRLEQNDYQFLYAEVTCWCSWTWTPTIRSSFPRTSWKSARPSSRRA
jgi:elongation factor P